MLPTLGVTNLYKVPSTSHARQRGFVFRLLHSLFIVFTVVILVVLYRTDHLRNVHEWPSQTVEWLKERKDAIGFASQVDSDTPRSHSASLHKVVRQQEEDSQYTSTGRFAVQVAAGYDSRQLYAWRDALIDDGFNAYLVSLNTSQGLLLKLRVGAFTARSSAEKLRERIINRYPEQGLFEDSFIVEGE